MRSMDIKKTVEVIKKWALDNYENGGDVIVEAFTDEEIVEQFIDERFHQPAATTVDDALQRAQFFCGVRFEVAEDIRAAGR